MANRWTEQQKQAIEAGGCDLLISAAAGSGKTAVLVERVIRKIIQEGQELQLRFTGNGFLYNMVRILTGTLIEVGTGQRDPDSVAALFGGKRADAGYLAPPQGLCLQEVFY